MRGQPCFSALHYAIKINDPKTFARMSEGLNIVPCVSGCQMGFVRSFIQVTGKYVGRQDIKDIQYDNNKDDCA